MHYSLITKEYLPDAVILGNGDFPSNSLPLAILHNANYICCCDGAAVHLAERGITPNAIVGDGDSLPQALKERYSHILHICSEQEDNDLTKATRFCAAKGFRRIAYLGATGRREDHTIANVSLMERYFHHLGVIPVMLTDYGYFIAARGTNTFDTFARQQVSIFNFSCNNIASKNLQWNAYAYKSWWQGTLNEPSDKVFTLEADGYMVVYFTYQPKT